MSEIEKTCPDCGDRFVTSRASKVYCKATCRMKAHHKKGKPHTCTACGGSCKGQAPAFERQS